MVNGNVETVEEIVVSINDTKSINESDAEDAR